MEGGQAAAEVDRALLEVARATHLAERRSEARRSTIVAGAIAIAALPAWAAFDRLLAPHEAPAFLTVRLVSMAVIAVLCAVLGWSRHGARHPELLSLLVVATIEVAIAWMLPRTGGQIEPYLLGMSLAVYATAFLVVWRWWAGGVLALLTAAAVALCSATAPVGLDHRQVTVATFYLGTAFALAMASQAYRERQRWRHHLTQADLEAQRRRNVALVGELEQLSRQDPLTALGNRRAWDEALTAAYLHARRSGRPLALLIVDVDRFKSINDRGGHAMGDSALRALGAVLRDAVGDRCFVARPGGDEFAVSCPDTTLDEAARIAAAIHAGVRRDPMLEELAMTCSIGAASLVDEDTSTAALYRRADLAMYDAKVTGASTRCSVPEERPDGLRLGGR
jgi:diguanylate cyclase (GGDEF)-like protein